MVTTSLVGGIPSRRLRLLENLVVAVEAVVLVYLVVKEGAESLLFPVLGAAGIVALAFLVATDWPIGAVLILLLGSATPRLAGTLFGLHVRPEHVAIACVLLAVIVRSRIKPWRKSWGWGALEFLLAAYVVLNFLSSILFSPEPRMTLRWAVMSAVVISSFFLAKWLITDERVLFRAFGLLLWVGALESVYGIVCFLSNRIFGTDFGVAAYQYGLIPGTHGTQYEANLFGSYAACCAVMFLALYLLAPESGRGALTLLGLALCTAGTLVSLSRLALVATLVVALLLFGIAMAQGKDRTKRLFFVVGSVAVLLLVISPFLLGFLQERFSTIDLEDFTSDSTTLVRLVPLVVAMDDIRVHPFFGTGTDSFQLTFSWRNYLGHSTPLDDDAGWISNSPVRILHDTGVVGLGVLLVFFGVLGVATLRAFRLARGQTRAVLAALAAGLLVYAITFQATEATLLAFPWLHLGLLGATLSVVNANCVNPSDRSLITGGHSR